MEWEQMWADFTNHTRTGDEVIAFLEAIRADAKREEREEILECLKAISKTYGGYDRSSDEAFAHGKALNEVLNFLRSRDVTE